MMDRAREEQLGRFLAHYGLTADDILAEVDEVFGVPLLVLATGSVLQGFGNECSDVDLNVIVDCHTVTQMPLMSYTRRARLDVTYYAAADVAETVERLRVQLWPSRGAVTTAAWLRQLRALGAASRFASGLVLRHRAGWDAWIARLRGPWLRDRVVRWWRVEAVRLRLAAHWLYPTKPLLACQRSCDAVLAALQSRAAAAGQIYLESYPDGKWLPEKLRAIGADHELAIVREVLRTPVWAAGAGAYQARCTELLQELAPEDGLPSRLVAQLRYAPGTYAWRVDSSTLVARWKMRGIELHGADLPEGTGDEVVIWEGSLDEVPNPPVLELFQEDMLWLSVTAREMGTGA